MHKRLSGLQHECDLVAAQVARYRAGELREYDLGPDGAQIDITDLWLAHLEAVLAVKRSLRKKLRERYKLDPAAPPAENPEGRPAPPESGT
jgi:hypothetical protein